MSRNRSKAKNSNDQYKDIFDEKGVKFIEQFRTPSLKKIPDLLPTFDYVWKQGDQYWSLSYKYFGNRKYWYVIALLNNKPTESHVSIGETIKIPYDIYQALEVIK